MTKPRRGSSRKPKRKRKVAKKRTAPRRISKKHAEFIKREQRRKAARTVVKIAESQLPDRMRELPKHSKWERDIRTIMRIRHVGRGEAIHLWRQGLQPIRREAMRSPQFVTRDRLAQRYQFIRRPDGSLNVHQAYDRVKHRFVGPASINRTRSAFLREARYREIMRVEGISYNEARGLVKEKYQGDTYFALVKVLYGRLVGKMERDEPRGGYEEENPQST